MQEQKKPFKILSLDGGGAKGFYTLGVLKEIELLVGKRLSKEFDLVFGTSTGSIIGSLIALGYSIDDITNLYREHVPTIMQRKTKKGKSEALASLADEIYKDKGFEDLEIPVGIVSTNWLLEKPMIFKYSVEQAHGRIASFVPGFGVSISDAVQASCSAYPFFEKKLVKTLKGDEILLIDGGYCANNPSLYAIAEATRAFKLSHDQLRVISIGVGTYPTPSVPFFSYSNLVSKLVSVKLLQKTLEINTQSMEQLRRILYNDISTVRINDSFSEPTMATDLFEYDIAKLGLLKLRGSESFARYETELKACLDT
ncbi:MAG: patatin [Sphingobacteriales bacterium]|nr:MAG: patatin [Sphingobacteriales bacterium]